MSRLRLGAFIAVLAVALRALVGHALVNYDTLYALVWGRDLGHGRLPDYAVSIAPTPHPLATAAGALLTPVSDISRHGVHGELVTSIVIGAAFVALAVLGWIVFRLGEAWFNPWVGGLAALILLTRQPVLDYGARAYVDIPYVALVLGALLVETRRPRAGAPVLGLLAVAGLLRPEAWLFSGAYLLWIFYKGERDRRRLAGLAGLAAIAPLLWLGSDLAVTGDALHSLTGTRGTARTLGRLTGITNLPSGVPPRLGEIVREPVLFGAAVGALLSLWWLRARAALGAVAGVLAMLAFAVLATAGLSILTRYLLAPAAILCIFCGVGAFGWLELEAGDRRRRWWKWAAAAVGIALLAFVPGQIDRIGKLRDTLARQDQIQGDLARLVRARNIGASCRPLAVPNHRPVPLLALWLNVEPGQVVSAAERRVVTGTYVTPATPQVASDYILDPRDPVKVVAGAPPGFTPAGGDRSWRVYKRACPSGR